MVSLQVECCPHCHEPLKRFALPDNTGWQEPYHLACFNDACPYFRNGWVWMFDRYGVKSSYRHRVIPTTGASSPLPVWSRDALKDRIIEDDTNRAALGTSSGQSLAAGMIPEDSPERGGRS